MGPFEPFDPKTPTPGRAPVIYSVSEGRLILNAAALRLIGQSQYVQLLWDEETKRIGIKPTSPQDPLALKVIRGNSQSTITSKAFVEAHKIPYKVRMLLAQESDIFVASVGDPNNPLHQ